MQRICGRTSAVVDIVLLVTIIGLVPLVSAMPAAATGTNRVTEIWAGYEQKPPAGVSYTGVKARFTVPTVKLRSCPNSNDPCMKSSTWVGIGGDPVPLVQTGTEADLHQDGTAEYWAWAEVVPDDPNQQVRLAVSVKPSDGIVAEVRETATDAWAMTVTNLTTGATASRKVKNYTVPQSSSSAELIHERTGNAPLTLTTNVVFDSASYSTSPPGPHLAWQPFFALPAGAALQDMQMCSRDDNQCPPGPMAATPSDVDSDNDGFQVADGGNVPPPPPSIAGQFSSIRDANFDQPLGMTLGPDGAVWVASFGNDSIDRVTAGGTVTRFTDPLIVGPSAIATGADGALWFTDAGPFGTNGAIARMSTTGAVTRYLDPSIDEPVAITAGPDGALWFANWGDVGSIGRITTDGTVSNFTDPGVRQPISITTGPDGNLWFTNAPPCRTSCGSSIGRITTGGRITIFTDPSIAGPSGITAGPDGALWFTNPNNSSIGRISTSGVVSNLPLTKPGSPQSITTGPDGAMWFTSFKFIVRLTPSGKRTYYGKRSLAFASQFPPPSIIPGPDGKLWFTDLATNGEIYRITTP
jgi:virginiamycin B lyase